MKTEYDELVEEVVNSIRLFIYTDVDNNPDKYPILINTINIIKLLRESTYPKYNIEVVKNSVYDLIIKETTNNLV